MRFLDFHRIRDAERQTAKEIFGTLAEPTELAQSTTAQKGKSAGVGVNGSGAGAGATKSLGGRMKMTDEEKERVRTLIKNAGSLAEITRLEKMLAEGRIPGVDGR